MEWNLDQFNQMCSSKNLPDSRRYQKALFWKRKKVEFLVLQSKTVWDDFLQTHFLQNDVSINSNDPEVTFAFKDAQFQSETYIEAAAQNWHSTADILCQIINNNDPEVTFAFKDAQFQSETYIEAAAQNLHSMIDILCQIINKAVINSRIDEAKVTIGETIQKLNKERNTQGIVNALEDLRDSHEFKYIAAFVNTIKHRRLLDTDYSVKFGQGKSNIMGVRFLSFEYEKPNKPTEKYDNTFAETIVNDYIKRIFDLIDGVGTATDTYIRDEIN